MGHFLGLKQRIGAIAWAIACNRIATRRSLAIRCALAVVALAVVATSAIVNAPVSSARSAQTAARSTTITTTKFAVASVKLCNARDERHPTGKQGEGGSVRWDPGRLDEECQILADIIRDAYLNYPQGKPWAAAVAGVAATSQVENFQCIGCGSGRGGIPPISSRLFWQPIKGSPGWVNSDRYIIDAKGEGPTSQEMMRGPMMQALLEERFKLKVHREISEIPVYNLIVAKGGPRLQHHIDGSCAALDQFRPGAGHSFTTMCGMMREGKGGGIEFNGSTIGNLCLRLSALADRDIVDKTGITGIFDIHFDAIPAERGPNDASQGSPTADQVALFKSERFAIFYAGMRKLGLKLEPAKGHGEFLVIDHVERPSAN